ncbi:hypothetical protein VNO77_14473 [Canavalia gladiata]|uniref:Uncharacterized protein n=1 Tax=Canavalia gladiata TaxID=3824 RepID=A0AAN9QQZ5_CANGL
MRANYYQHSSQISDDACSLFHSQAILARVKLVLVSIGPKRESHLHQILVVLKVQLRSIQLTSLLFLVPSRLTTLGYQHRTGQPCLIYHSEELLFAFYLRMDIDESSVVTCELHFTRAQSDKACLTCSLALPHVNTAPLCHLSFHERNCVTDLRTDPKIHACKRGRHKDLETEEFVSDTTMINYGLIFERIRELASKPTTEFSSCMRPSSPFDPDPCLEVEERSKLPPFPGISKTCGDNEEISTKSSLCSLIPFARALFSELINHQNKPWDSHFHSYIHVETDPAS